MEDYLRDLWQPGLEELAGSRRTITDESQVSPTSVRFTVTGDRGHALVTIRFDEDGGVDGFALDREVVDGIANFVITCPDERVAELSSFYGALLGVDKWRLPILVFERATTITRPSGAIPIDLSRCTPTSAYGISPKRKRSSWGREPRGCKMAIVT